MEAVTKAQQIMDLGGAGHSTREIAEKVYGLSPEASYAERSKKMAYIRVVLRQRKGGSISDIEVRSIIKRFGSMKAFYDDRNAKTQDYRNGYYRKRWREDEDWRRARIKTQTDRRLKNKLAEARESA